MVLTPNTAARRGREAAMVLTFIPLLYPLSRPLAGWDGMTALPFSLSRPLFCYNPPMTDPQAETIRHILTNYRTVAVVGFSDRDRRKAAFYAPAYLKGHGYTILPINPRLTTGLNRPAYPTLADAPGPIDVALIYAAGARVGPLVDEAIAIGAKAVWLPIGVVDEAAAARARAAGLLVVMDRCMMVEHKHLEI